MSASIFRRAVLLGFSILMFPAASSAETLTPIGVFADAALPIKAIMLGLALAGVAAVAVCATKLAAGAALSGGSAFLSGLRLGGPLAGLVGAAYTGLMMAMGVANAPTPLPATLLARGWAEVMALLLFGLLSGAIAVMANWAVDARIDRAVLKA